MRRATPAAPVHRASSLGLREPEGAARQYSIKGHRLAAPSLQAGLYLVATPIGNLGDITVRALETLAAADLIACEDTRRSRKLLDAYAIRTPLTPYHDHNAVSARPRLIERLAQGAAVALISDAGTPLVSDPGYTLAREAHLAGISITTLPGPSAVLAALAVSGIASDRFLFDGFLPARQAARRARIAALSSIPATLILFETAPRLAEALADLAAGLGARETAICRELTKLHEEVLRGNLASLARACAGEAQMRGEMVIVIAPPPPTPEMKTDDLDALLRSALDRLSLKEAVEEIAALSAVPRRTIYQRALALRAAHGGESDIG